MWRSMMASWHHNDAWIWEEHTKVLGDDGLSYEDITQYEDLMIYFVQLPARLVRGEHGYRNSKRAEAIVPSQQLIDLSIIPSTHSSHLRFEDELYRVIGIDDWSRMIQNNCYSLTLERVEFHDR